jgi:hypothetical protein
MPAADALTVRTLVQEQLQGQTFRSIIDAYVQAELEYGTWSAAIRNSAARAFSSTGFAGAMAVAETYYLGPEMHDICVAASQASDFPEDEAILREDPPSEAGFMHLPARLRVVELRGRVMYAHAVLWLHERVWWLCDRRDPEDELNQELNRQANGQTGMPRYDLMSVSGFEWGEPIPKQIVFEKGVLPTDARVEWVTGPDGSRQMVTDAVVDPSLHGPVTQASPELRFLLAVWRIMQQTLAEVVRDESANKPTRRYAQRAGIKDFGINVIQLRRREGRGETGTGKALTVRFPVRGHWRRIWCGPAENRYQRAIYVHPYLKGPDGAPLIRRERINALVR